MAKPNLHYRSALAGLVRPGRIGTASGVAGVVAQEVQCFAAVSIIAGNGKVAATAAHLSKLFETLIVDGPKRVASGSISVSGVAPGQWLVIERDLSRTALLDLSTSLIDLAAVVDQSDSRLVLELTGEHVRATLSKGIPVDLDASVFKPGDVAQTMAAHISVQVSLMTEQSTFEVVTAASTAGSLWSWLTASAAEYGFDVV